MLMSNHKAINLEPQSITHIRDKIMQIKKIKLGQGVGNDFHQESDINYNGAGWFTQANLCSAERYG